MTWASGVSHDEVSLAGLKTRQYHLPQGNYRREAAFVDAVLNLIDSSEQFESRAHVDDYRKWVERVVPMFLYRADPEAIHQRLCRGGNYCYVPPGHEGVVKEIIKDWWRTFGGGFGWDSRIHVNAIEALSTRVAPLFTSVPAWAWEQRWVAHLQAEDVESTTPLYKEYCCEVRMALAWARYALTAAERRLARQHIQYAELFSAIITSRETNLKLRDMEEWVNMRRVGSNEVSGSTVEMACQHRLDNFHSPASLEAAAHRLLDARWAAEDRVAAAKITARDRAAIRSKEAAWVEASKLHREPPSLLKSKTA